jgi:putative DNA primase/helicase
MPSRQGSVPGSLEKYAASYEEFQFTDAQVAERFSNEALIGSYCWTKELGWLKWDTRRWQEIPTPVMLGVVRDWVKEQYVQSAVMVAEAKESGNKALDNLCRAIHSEWLAYQSSGKISAVAKLSQPDVIRKLSEFDAKPDLLNVRNGVIDLRTGELSPHDPELMLTRLANTDYHPGATHHDWLAALEAVPEDMRDWFQMRCGQSITGYRPDDAAVIIERGSGANGKNTIMEAFLKTLGDYFTVASHRVLLGTVEQHSTELSDLYGSRMVWLDELPEGRYLPAARIKQLTSGQFKARKIARDDMLIEVDYSLFVSTNYLPNVNETDEGTWRRLFLMHFPYRFRKDGQELTLPTDKPGDANLRPRLRRGKRQHQAILAWLVQGRLSFPAGILNFESSCGVCGGWGRARGRQR